MKEMKYIYGPVPSRRLGVSLGVSPIPKKTCNYSCVYCQLGRTDHMTNRRQMYFTVEEIMDEFDEFLKNSIKFDVVTIVGEGEPTLYLGLGELISEIQKRTDKPVAVITNGALLYDPDVRSELYNADIVLPTLDAYDDESFKRINRPYSTIDYGMVSHGLKTFSEEYQGQLWLEIMLIKGMNDDDESLRKYAKALENIKYDKIYINTPIRPPAEFCAEAIDSVKMNHAADILGGISIELVASQGFRSIIADPYNAIMSIIKRHPMNQFEIEIFLKSRGCGNVEAILDRLKKDSKVTVVNYKGYDSYRLK